MIVCAALFFFFCDWALHSSFFLRRSHGQGVSKVAAGLDAFRTFRVNCTCAALPIICFVLLCFDRLRDVLPRSLLWVSWRPAGAACARTLAGVP